MANINTMNSDMNIEICCRGGLTLTEGIRNYVHEKIAPLQHHFANIIQAHVILSVDRKFQHNAEVTIHLPPKKEVFAKHTSKDLYAAIDELVPKLKKQIDAHKGKLKLRSGNSPIL